MKGKTLEIDDATLKSLSVVLPNSLSSPAHDERFLCLEKLPFPSFNSI